MRFCYVLMGLTILIAVGTLASSSYAKIDPASIVGFWLLDEDEGNQAADSSENGHHAVVAQNGKWVEGKYGSALEGISGEMIEVQHDEALSLETFTFTVWVKLEPAGLGAWQATMGKQVDNPTRNFRFEIDEGGKPRISFASGGQAGAGSVYGTTMVVDQEWHHLAATYDMKELKIYVDGLLEGTQQKNLEPETNQEPLLMGMIRGVMDELAMFNVALDEEDILRIKDEGLSKVLGPAAVKPSGKLSTTWAEVKTQY